MEQMLQREEEGEGGGKTRIAKSVRMITEQKYSSVHNVLKATRFTLERDMYCREPKLESRLLY